MVVVNARFLTQRVTGVQRFAIEMCKILKKIMPDIVFVSPKNILHNELAIELGAILIGTHSGNMWEQVDLRFYLNNNKKPLLVNLCNTGLLFYGNQIVTIHDMSYKVNPSWFSKKFYLWYNFLIPHIANRSLKILTVSNSSKEDLIKYLNISSDKISVIYNSTSLANVIEKNSGSESGKYLLTISSFDPRKNLSNLIDAFNSTESDIKLVIVGLKSNNFGVAFDNKLLNDKIIIKGYVSDEELVGLIKQAEAFVYISLYEGFGLPPLEAMQFDCPVLLSDIPVHREVYENSALYTNPLNVNDIKSKIDEIVANDNLKKQLVELGTNNLKRFSWNQSANKLLTIINEFNKK